MIPLRKIEGKDNPADLNTKNVSAQVRRRHAGCLKLEYRDGRSQAAAQLHAVNKEDHWTKRRRVSKELQWIRVHKTPRLGLFCPSTADGKVEVKGLRVTEGKFLKSGCYFKLVDNWLERGATPLAEPWTGNTSFDAKT